MTDFERKQATIDMLRRQEKATVRELSEALMVSEITIRRDLQSLENQGLLTRYHGGAVLKQPLTAYSHKNDKNLSQKKLIGAKACEFVEAGDKIFMDCGSTVFQMCKHLGRKKNLRVITNSIPVLLELEQMGNVNVNLVGGEYDPVRRATHGAVATQHLEMYRADKAFIGVDGVSLEKGLSSHTEHEMINSLKMAQMASEVFALADATKLERDAHVKLIGWRSVDVLVTDKSIPQPTLKQYREANIEVALATGR